MCMYMYNFIYSQTISCRRLLSLFWLSMCINGFVWHNSSIRKHEYESITPITIQFGESLQSKLSFSELLLLRICLVHVFWCRRQTPHLRFQTSVRSWGGGGGRAGEHTDWEMAPPSYELLSSGNHDLNEHLRIFYPHEPPYATVPVRII